MKQFQATETDNNPRTEEKTEIYLSVTTIGVYIDLVNPKDEKAIKWKSNLVKYLQENCQICE
jgi:hypothetical protein